MNKQKGETKTMTNPFTAFFNKVAGVRRKLQQWRELNSFVSFFFPFGKDMYKSDIVRACIRTISDLTAKAVPYCEGDPELERLLLYRPNLYMNGKDFLYKIRTHYELTNTAFVVIMRDPIGKIEGLYPMPCTSYEALEDVEGNLYIRFNTATDKSYVFSWDDIIVLRKDYNSSDIAGDDNVALFPTLELINTANQSVSNAIKSTANLRGVIKTTKSMVKREDLKQSADDFMNDYMTLTNEGGIAYLDSSMEFEPINMTPSMATWTHMREFRENVFRYFGCDDDILMGKASPEKMQSFYEIKIEPFLQALSLEATSKIYTPRQLAFGRKIEYKSSTIQFMSMSEKLALKDFIDRGAITPNTWCDIVGLPHVEGGDKPIRRLDTAPVDKVAESVATITPTEEEQENANQE